MHVNGRELGVWLGWGAGSVRRSEKEGY